MNNTKTCYLDANILVFFKESSSDQHDQAVSIIERLVADNFKLFVSPLALDEFLYAALRYLRKKNTHDQDIKKELKDLLSSILEIPNLEIINPPTAKNLQIKVVDLITDFSLRPRDAYHLLIMKTHKIKYFLTFDSDFYKVFKANVVKSVR
ncbi:MAG: type II toxin-antitoxin system VapC family toxin [Patescibacteria group bacterium]